MTNLQATKGTRVVTIWQTRKAHPDILIGQKIFKRIASPSNKL